MGKSRIRRGSGQGSSRVEGWKRRRRRRRSGWKSRHGMRTGGEQSRMDRISRPPRQQGRVAEAARDRRRAHQSSCMMSVDRCAGYRSINRGGRHRGLAESAIRRGRRRSERRQRYGQRQRHEADRRRIGAPCQLRRLQCLSLLQQRCRRSGHGRDGRGAVNVGAGRLAHGVSSRLCSFPLLALAV